MDPKLLEALKARVNDEKDRFVIVEEGHLEALASCLVTDEEDNALVVDALEILFFLSTEGSLRPKIAAVDGLVNNVKKFMSRGRLKQKKLAIMTYKNLQVPFNSRGKFKRSLGPQSSFPVFAFHSLQNRYKSR